MDPPKVLPRPVPRGIKVTLLFSGILIGVLVIEAASRALLWHSQRHVGTRIHDFFYYDENRIFRIKPNSRGWTVGGEGRPVMITVNSEGLRGPELRASPSQRIVFTGDSIVFNGGVEMHDTFVALLADRFHRDGQDVEVVNAGTTDVGIEQYVRQARYHRFGNYKPDMIVIGLYLNDSRPPQGFVGEDQDVFLEFLKAWPVKYLALTHTIKEGYIIVQQKRGQKFTKRFDWVPRYLRGKWMHSLEEFRQTVQEAQYDWGAAWYESFQETIYPALIEINQIYASKGIKLALVLFPVSPQVYTHVKDPFIDQPQRTLATLANERKIPFLDVLPDVRKHKDKRLFSDHCHLDEFGSRVVADSIYPFLKDILTTGTEPFQRRIP